MIQFVSCSTDVSMGAALRHFIVQITDGNVTKLLGQHYVAPQHYAEGHGVHVYTASQPIVLSAHAGQIVHVLASSAGAIGGVKCGLSGVRQTLG